MKKITQSAIRHSAFIIAFAWLLMPAAIFAEEPAVTGLVTCTTNCGWNDLMAMVNKVINFLLVDLALPIAAIMFAYAGFKLTFSGGEPEARGTAKKIFLNTVIGLVIAVAAWLIISTILAIMGFDGTWIGLYVKIQS